ncbi:hypothetical protein ACO0RG_004628 [Hanseniaspora osmophila]
MSIPNQEGQLQVIEIESQIISKYFQLVDEFGKFNRDILSGVNKILVESVDRREAQSGETQEDQSGETQEDQSGETQEDQSGAVESVIQPDNELGIMDPLSLQLKYLEYLIENTDPKESLMVLDKIEQYLRAKEV